MARKKLISAAIVTGMAVSGAQAAHDDASKGTSTNQGQVRQDRDQRRGGFSDETLPDGAGVDGSPDSIPSFFGGDAVADQAGDMFGAPLDLDSDLLHHFDGSDAPLILHEDIVIEAEDGAMDDDWFQLAQTVYGGVGNDGIMSPGVRNKTRIPGGNRTNVGSGVEAPRVGTPVTPRTVPNKQLQTRQNIQRGNKVKNKRK